MFEKMTADEIFKSMGYELSEKTNGYLMYKKRVMTADNASFFTQITFHFKGKYYDTSMEHRDYCDGTKAKDGAVVSMYLHLAIDKKLKELGWL